MYRVGTDGNHLRGMAIISTRHSYVCAVICEMCFGGQDDPLLSQESLTHVLTYSHMQCRNGNIYCTRPEKCREHTGDQANANMHIYEASPLGRLSRTES